MRTSLSCLLLGMLALSPVLSYAQDLKPRAEVNFRAGTDRSILMTEFWAPLAQQNDRVLYGDLRLMSDDGDNREGNLGFGYRQISKKTNSVLGANAWIDRRRTENGNHFHQLTLGVESLGDKIDLRANGYIQLNSAKARITPNIGSTSPYLAGNGIFYDTNGFIVEEPQDGFDAEIGYRLPVFQKHVDATRVYAGGYHFWGDQTDNVTGFRLRTEAQINSIFSVGARFQHDGPRGSQGFLEATLRFPFSAKKSFQKDGLRSRLNESPERDIDIVTGTKVDNGLMKPVLNTTSGTAQRILYVDNTNTNAGDGSKDNPFNTLAAAQTALQANDILYVNRGDGTTTGMDQGITIDKAGVSLIGSGSALTYGGFTLLNAGLAPTITSTQTSIDTLTGNGVTALADNFSVSGITVSGTSGYGIYALADGKNFNSLNISNNSVFATVKHGILAQITNGSTIQNINLDHNTTSNNQRGTTVILSLGSRAENINVSNNNVSNSTEFGVIVNLGSSSHANSIVVNNNTVNSSLTTGIYVLANNGSTINTAVANNNTSNGNGQYGMWLQANNVDSLIKNLSTANNTTNNNTSYGLYVASSLAGTLDNTTIDSNSASGNSAGIYVQSASAGSLINKINITNNIVNSNNSTGLYVTASTSGIISNVMISSLQASNNQVRGMYILGTSGTIANTMASNVTANSNGNYGIIIQGNGANGIIGNAELINSIANNNGQSGVYIYANSSGSLINAVSLSNVITNNNAENGLNIYANAVGKINALTITNHTANNNNQNGIYAVTQSVGSLLDRFSISNSNFLNNGVNGIYLYKISTGTTLNADLGGGSYGSVGQNRIFGNTSNDVRLNYNGGGSAIAMNNWWGVNAAPTRITLSASTTLNTANYLTTDPRP